MSLNRHKLKGLVTLLCFLFVFVANAQRSYRVDQYTTASGLSSNIASSLVRDSYGFLWSRTEMGISRYDGYTFSGFNYNPNDPTTINQSVETFNGLYLDDIGNIWFIYNGIGTSYYNKELDSFVHFDQDTSEQNWVGNEDVRIVYSYDENIVWIGTTKNLYQYSHKSKKTIRVDGISNMPIKCLFKDNLGNVWIGTGDGTSYNDSFGLFLYEKSKNEIQKIGTENLSINDILQDKNGRVWLATNKGIGKVMDYSPSVMELSEAYIELTNFTNEYEGNNTHRNNIVKLFESDLGKLYVGSSMGFAIFRGNNGGEDLFDWHFEDGTPDYNGQIEFLNIDEDKDGNIWLASTNRNYGLVIIDHKTGEVRSKIEETFLNTELKLERRFIDMFIDDMNIIWLGTDGSGIIKLDLNQKKFNTIQHRPGHPKSIVSNNIQCFAQSKEGDLWIGTTSGLTQFNPVKKEIQNFTPSSMEMNSSNILSIYFDQKDNLWLGHSPQQVSKIDLKTGKNSPFRHKGVSEDSFDAWTITDIKEDKNGNIWMGTHDFGLFKSINGEKKFDIFLTDSTERLNEVSINTIQIIEDTIWVGTPKGLYTVNEEIQKLVKAPIKDGKFKTINSGINAILPLNDVLWLGTQSEGILGYNLTKQELKQFTNYDGLPSNSIMSIVLQNDSTLWLSTKLGISEFNLNSKSFTNFNVFDGLPDNSFNLGAGLITPSGHIYFGGSNGVVYFDPEEIDKNPYMAKPIITSFYLFNKKVDPQMEVNGQVVLKKTIRETDEIRLNYKNNIFSFEFTSMHFASPQNSKFAYKLKNFEEGWNYVGSDQRIASYTSLPSGNYIFQIKATNNDGIWGDQIAQVDIFILPSWWNTTWFRLLIILALVALGVLFYRLRIKSIESRNENLESLVEKKTEDLEKQNRAIQKMAEKLHESDQSKIRFYMNISHEFRTPLTLIIGPIGNLLRTTYLQPNDREQIAIAERNAHRLLRLTNQLLDTSEVDKDTLKLAVAQSDVVQFVGEIVDAFNYRASYTGIQYFFNRKVKRYDGWFDGDKLEKILYNLISNAFKFVEFNNGFNNKIEVELNIVDGRMIVLVRDNGVGISEEDQKNIFELFYQVEEQSNRRSGTGIGLNLAMKLAEKHKGKLSVSSQPGIGSEFNLELPVLKSFYEDDELAEDQINLKDRVESIQKLFIGNNTEMNELIDRSEFKLILLVEDSVDMRTYIKGGLESKFKILEAGNGEEGLKIAERMIPDIIISDVMMPIMNGIELCEQIKNNDYLSHIPIILLTAKENVQSKIDGYQVGADDYLTKPFDMQLLIARIESLLQSRMKLREAFIGHEELVPTVGNKRDDQVFLEKAVKVVEQNITNPNLNYQQFVEEFGISKTKLYDRINKLTGQSINLFIRSIRLKISARLILDKEANFSEISYKVGFSDPSYFSKCFKQEFGMPPKEYLDSKRNMEKQNQTQDHHR